MDWSDRYIGIPFVDGGRDESGADCWGLVRLVLSREFGISLPTLSREYETVEDRERIRSLVDETKPLIGAQLVDRPEPGDIAVIRIRGLSIHVGVYVGFGRLLHTLRRTGSILVRLDTMRSNVEGWYRVGRS